MVGYYKSKRQPRYFNSNIKLSSGYFHKNMHCVSVMYSSYCAYFQMGCQWRSIAITMRDEVFEKDEHGKIDIFDVQVSKF